MFSLRLKNKLESLEKKQEIPDELIDNIHSQSIFPFRLLFLVAAIIYSFDTYKLLQLTQETRSGRHNVGKLTKKSLCCENNAPSKYWSFKNSFSNE